ncbi:hypothetical protein HWV62_27309 [Athelia sp. TMB]|nr:hypothetical protein HWV62_27309 [Athelia sp. TMB]
MSTFPHSNLFLRPNRAVVISGPHAQILDSNTGEILHSTMNLDEAAKDGVLKTGPIRCAALDVDGVHLVTSGDDKILKVWLVEGLVLLHSRELPKKPTRIQFTKDSQTLVISDKFGDTFSYPLHPVPTPTRPTSPSPLDETDEERIKRRRAAVASHENPSGGTLILGHASLMTTFVLSEDERYVISADRDEHVRVSWYPQGWNIESFCLGHEKYVTAVHIPSFAPETLISGGGDTMLKVWDWMAGKLKAEVEVWETAQKFLLAKGYKKIRGQWGKKNEDTTAGVEQGGKTRKERREKNRKGKEAHLSELGEAKDDEAEAEADGVGEGNDSYPTASQTETIDLGEFILVIHKIQSLQLGTSQLIVFTAVGASALFITTLPSDVTSGSTQAFDFGRPVIDFTLESAGVAWVLLDGGWGEQSGIVQVVKRVRCTAEGQFQDIEGGPEAALLLSLNTICCLPATAEELKALELYSLLSSMPKNLSDEPDEETKAQAAATKRQQGRMKNKRHLMKVVEGSQVRDSEPPEDDDSERAIKRTKSIAEEVLLVDAMDES